MCQLTPGRQSQEAARAKWYPRWQRLCEHHTDWTNWGEKKTFANCRSYIGVNILILADYIMKKCPWCHVTFNCVHKDHIHLNCLKKVHKWPFSIVYIQYNSNPTNSNSKNTLHSTNRVKSPFFFPSLTLLKYLASNELISDQSSGSKNYKYWQIHNRMFS